MNDENPVLLLAKKVEDIANKVYDADDRKTLQDAYRLIIAQKEFNDDLRKMLALHQ